MSSNEMMEFKSEQDVKPILYKVGSHRWISMADFFERAGGKRGFASIVASKPASPSSFMRVAINYGDGLRAPRIRLMPTSDMPAYFNSFNPQTSMLPKSLVADIMRYQADCKLAETKGWPRPAPDFVRKHVPDINDVVAIRASSANSGKAKQAPKVEKEPTPCDMLAEAIQSKKDLADAEERLAAVKRELESIENDYMKKRERNSELARKLLALFS